MDTHTKELLTADELARRLHVKRRTVQQWAKAGIIPKIQPSPKVIRFDLAAVMAALESNKGVAR